MNSGNKKLTVATTWLDGCSGCHMSFLDLDQRLFDLAEKADIVYGPLVDFKELPEDVDVGIIEGAVSTEEDLEKAHRFRPELCPIVARRECGFRAADTHRRKSCRLATKLHPIGLESSWRRRRRHTLP